MQNKFISNFLTMLSGNTISQLIPFLLASLLTRIYLPTEFSVFSNILAISTLFGIVSCGRLELAIPLPKDKNKAQDILFTAIIITIIVSLLSCIVYFLSEKISVFYNNEILNNFLFYVPICVLSFGLLGITNNWILRNKEYKLLSTIKILQSIINNFGALAFGLLGYGITGLILSWLLSQFLPVIYILFKEKISWKKNRFTIDIIKNIIINYKDFLMINSLHAFMDILATQVLMFWIISNFFGDENLGLYSQMNKYIKAPIILITSSVSQIFYVEASKAIQDNLIVMPYLKKTLKTTLIFSIPFIIIIFFFGPQLFSWFFGTKFIDYGIAGEMAKNLLPSLFLMFIVSPISGLPILFNKQKLSFIFSLFGYIISLLVFYFAATNKYNLNNSLFYFSILFSIYYLFLLYWYIKLIRKHDVCNN